MLDKLTCWIASSINRIHVTNFYSNYWFNNYVFSINSLCCWSHNNVSWAFWAYTSAFLKFLVDSSIFLKNLVIFIAFLLCCWIRWISILLRYVSLIFCVSSILKYCFKLSRHATQTLVPIPFRVMHLLILHWIMIWNTMWILVKIRIL